MSLSFTLFLSTFVLEDVALASALALIAQQKITFSEAFFICSLGIGLGDLGLYFLGRFANHIPYFRKKIEFSNLEKLDAAIVISRAIPGTRLPTYLAAGALRYSLFRFSLLTVISVGLWVFIALYFGEAFFLYFNENWLVSALAFLFTFSILKKVISNLQNKWTFKAFLQSWRQWLHFEFWPAWLFYLPVVPIYIYLSIRHRSFLIPFYANPHLKHAGLIGESKWDFLQHLDTNALTTLPACKINKTLSLNLIEQKMNEQNVKWPFIIKPNVGQRGFGVRIIKNIQDFSSYLERTDKVAGEDYIIQQKSQFFQEAGVFYVRHPGATKGHIFSITDKKFPFVIGDGKTKLGQLILQDKRARVIASTYFARHHKMLEHVLFEGEKYFLSECGNHCQGAIFLNGSHLSTPELLDSIELIANRIPDFYFGRIDIRYESEENLKKGIHYEIVEINGAGSEATHIWDPKTTLWEAYYVLYKQWSHLFAIGYALKAKKMCKSPQVAVFIFDCLKVYLRTGPLTVSS